MAFDAELQIVDSQVVDVSEGTSQLSDAGGSVEGVNQLTLGKAGLVDSSWFYVVIEAGTLDDTVDPVKFVLQCAFDGTNYHDIAVIHFIGNDTVKVGVYGVPVGPVDGREDVRLTAALNILRVRVEYTDGTATDDITYSAYIGGPSQFRGVNT